jgi:hydrogenase nickel incorporation protein HypA/HybF
MHEFGMCEGLVELIRRRAQGRRVTGARVRVGARHAVTEEAFGQAFCLAAAGTAVQDVALELVITPVTVMCRSCGQASESLDLLAVCAHCGGADVELRDGDELVLESVSFQPAPVPEEGARDVSRHPR